jgi:hypothetical protein
MLARVRAPAQAVEVQVPRVAEVVSKVQEQAVRYMPQTEHGDVLSPALRAASAHRVLDIGLWRAEPRE